MLRRVNREILGKGIEEPHPPGMPASAMQKDERLRPRSPAAQQTDARAVDHDHFLDIRHHFDFLCVFSLLAMRYQRIISGVISGRTANYQRQKQCYQRQKQREISLR
jgi:hypothetical protein